MNKEEVIARYGEAEYNRRLAQRREHYRAHREQVNARNKKYREEHREQERARDKKYNEEHQEQVIANSHERCRKGGKHYEKTLKDNRTGLQGARNKIRRKHRGQYQPYKDIIAPESQLHHEWVPKTDKYRGVALVEKDQHMHGFVDVIEILDGKITVLTEEEIRKGKKNEKEDI